MLPQGQATFLVLVEGGLWRTCGGGTLEVNTQCVTAVTSPALLVASLPGNRHQVAFADALSTMRESTHCTLEVSLKQLSLCQSQSKERLL